jgi:DtxR family transcriptional regulator, manganese transport regulator
LNKLQNPLQHIGTAHESEKAETQTEAFRRDRELRKLALNDDYLELIADLIAETGEARTVDIAARLGVAQPTVTKVVARLKREGLVVSEPYRAIYLTDSGKALAAQAKYRHQIIVSFLSALGVDSTTAERDAEGIEHHVSAATLEAFVRFLGTAKLKT